MAMRNVVLVTLAALIAVARLGGVKHEAFQAAAHLFVGGLAARWATSRGQATVAADVLMRWREWRWSSPESLLFWGLCLVEIGCFLADEFLH